MQRARTLIVFLLASCALCTSAFAGREKPASHTARTVEGWSVRVDDRLLSGAGAETGEHALRLLANRLYEIAFILPADKVARLRGVTIQIDLAHGELVSAQYHPSAEWLVQHGYSRDLARCVHIPDAGEWASHRHQTVQPWSLLHELAHAYHDQVIGFDEPDVIAAWERFRADARHEATLHIDGAPTRHYALTDHKEFFAEMTESYFGTNDFEPFNRAELAVQEPEVLALMRRIWTAPPKQPLNIVLLYADDWRHDTLGCAGNPVVQTPRLDALARDGVRFTQNRVTTAICGVSRASMLTGQWMSRHGNRAFDMFKTPWAETLPGVLRANGYWVGHIGKWHNGKFPAAEYDSPASALANGTHWVKQPDGTLMHVTQKNERDAIDFLRARPADKPFCLTVAFFATHAEDGNKLQYLPQPASMSLYADVDIPVPPTATDAAFRALPPFLANDRNEGRNRWKWRFDTPARYQEYMKNYYRLATEVDTACGRVIDELARQGVLDRTLVIFTTDNGYFHGEHGLADKWYPFEESIRVPLIVRDPRMPAAKRGTTNDALTLNVDLAPTLLAAAGLSAPALMQGRDIAPLYLDAHPPAWRSDFYYEHPMLTSRDFIPASEAVVARDWKYILWPDWGVEQLFDLARDPREERDLAADPAHAPRLAAMRARLGHLKSQAQTPAQSPDR